MNLRAGAIVIVCLMLAACGGGGRDVPIGTESQLDYANAGQARPSYAPYATGSHAYSWDTGTGENDVREFYVGGDLEPRESLRHILTESGIRYYMGASRDGVGVDRLV